MAEEGVQGRRGIRECPIFYPTAEEFGNFEEYVLSIEPQCLEHGICKVVPPAGWRPRTSPYEDKDAMVLNGPIRQEAIGHSGTYQCMNVTQKPMTIGEFKKLALKEENLPPLQEHELTWTPEQRAKADFWDLEKKYWQSISLKPPVYGADNFSASFFEDCAGAWSVSLAFYSGGLRPSASSAAPANRTWTSSAMPSTRHCASASRRAAA